MTGGQWQGQWEGAWFGATAPAPEGSVSGATSFAFAATGTLTDGGGGTAGEMTGGATMRISASATLSKNPMLLLPLMDLLGGGGGKSQRQQAANEHEARIRRQNELIVALVTAAVTEGMMA